MAIGVIAGDREPTCPSPGTSLGSEALLAEVHTGDPSDLLAGWRALWRDEDTPFMTPAWGLAWWRHYGHGATPLTVAVHDGGELAGLALLAVQRRGPLRIVVPVGVSPGDWWDVLARSDVRRPVTDAVACALLERSRSWDVAVLRLLAPRPGLLAALDRAGALTAMRRPVQAPAVCLPATFEDYLAQLGRSRRSNLRRHLKRLDSGEVGLRTVDAPGDIAGALDRWQGFRREQWSAQGREINADHLSSRFRAFVEDVVRELAPAGHAQLWEFTHDDEVVGSYLNFCDAKTYFWYLGGYAPAAARLGLGKIAIGHGIRCSIQADRRVYDFAQGSEPYKYWYGAADRLMAGAVVGTSRPRSLAVLGGARLAVDRPPHVTRRLSRWIRG